MRGVRQVRKVRGVRKVRKVRCARCGAHAQRSIGEWQSAVRLAAARQAVVPALLELVDHGG